METSGLQRRFKTHNKAMKNDETDRCSRRVHSINFIKYNSEYHPFNCNNAVQVGPPLKNQAVTKRIVAAFSFILNTNLNTTLAQLISAAIDSRHVHALVFKFCVQTMAGEKEKIWGPIFFCPASIYRFRFNRAYIKPEPNQNRCLEKDKQARLAVLLPIFCNFVSWNGGVIGCH